jgi:hypothetical protein
MIKRKGKSLIENLILDNKFFKRKDQMRSDWGMLYIIRNIFFESYKLLSFCFHKKTQFEKDMNVQSFGIAKVPVLGLPFGSPMEK